MSETSTHDLQAHAAASADADQRLDHVCSDPVTCEAELARLRARLAELEYVPWAPSGGTWWRLLGVGVALLALIPLPVTLLLGGLGQLAPQQQEIVVPVQAAAIALPMAQLSLLATIAVLHPRPWWQRALCFVGLGGICQGGMIVNAFVADPGQINFELLLTLGPWLPFSVCFALLPVFVAQAWGRWTLAPRAANVAPRAVSLGSYFFLISVFALSLAATRWIHMEGMDFGSNAEAALAFLVYVVSPGLAIGVVNVTMLPATLTARRSHWTIWMLRGLAIVLSILVAPTVLCGLIPALGTPDFQLDAEVALFLYLFNAGATAVALLMATAGFAWIHLLGYKLITKNDRRAEVTSYGAATPASGEPAVPVTAVQVAGGTPSV